MAKFTREQREIYQAIKDRDEDSNLNYQFTDFTSFKKFNSWIGPNEINKIHPKSLKILKTVNALKKTNLFGGNKLKFKGGLFHNNNKILEMLLFFDFGMFYCYGTSSFFEGFTGRTISKILRYNYKIQLLSQTQRDLNWDTYCDGLEYMGISENDDSGNNINKGDYLYDYVRGGSKGHGRSSYNGFVKNEDIHICLQEIEKHRLEIEKQNLEKRNNRDNRRKEIEDKRLKELQVSQTNVLSELDKDGNGEVDVVEGNDFNTLLKKHQKSILEVDRNYVQQFVKVSSYLKTKKGNIQSIFNSIKDTPNQEVLNEYVEILKGNIHSYNLILFNSLNMIVSLVEDDMITFYEIHEMFDTLNMFDSKHEKDVSQKLTNIGDGLESLMNEIRDVGNQISNSIEELSYVTEKSNQQLQGQLSEIDSTLKVGNLISVINTYQNYKINQNTKSLKK